MLEIINPLVEHFTANTKDGGALFFFTFVFGNFVICLIVGLGCVITKKITIIYDFFGCLLGGSIVAMFANLVLLMPGLFLRVPAQPMFYAGCVVTLACHALIVYNFGTLNFLGKALSND